MLKNYLVIAIRHLLRSKLYTGINVCGLAVGLICFLLIFTFVRHELSYESGISRSDRIYRINREFLPQGDNPGTLWASCAPKAGPLLKSEFPEIEETVRLIDWSITLVQGPEKFMEKSYFADAGFFEVFDFPLIAGDPGTALNQPFNAVITKSLAIKYFGSQDPIGQTLSDGEGFDIKVTGLIDDLPENTHLAFTMVTSISTLTSLFGKDYLDTWGNNIYHTYALLAKGADMDVLSQQFPAFLDKYNGNAKGPTALRVQKLSDIHLHSDLQMELKENGNVVMVRAFTAIALFVLIIACINFMNLSTARSSQRAKEVGMRKVFGSDQSQLVTQFLGESLLLVTTAVGIALIVTSLLLERFGGFMGRDLSLELTNVNTLAFLIGLTLFIALIAGGYPAFFLSAFKPSKVLRGELTRGSSGILVRKAMVVLQFAISIFLLIATGVVYRQMDYTNTMDLGYDRENTIILRGGAKSENFESFRNQLQSSPAISYVTRSDQVPTQSYGDTRMIRAQDNDSLGRKMFYMRTDHDFFAAYGCQFLAGRNFSRDHVTDAPRAPGDEEPHTTGAFILNETAARQLGWTPETAVSKWFELNTGADFDKSIKGSIIGVIKDAHFASLREPIKPTFYYIDPDSHYRFTSIKIAGDRVPEALSHLDQVWAEHFPAQSIRRSFLSDNYAAMYNDERKQSQMFTYFSLLAVFIGCMGLFGLASFTTERRSKEIGIRKAIGASSWSIIVLLTVEFSKLVLFANVLAWPVAYYIMRGWLNNFAYRITPHPLIFIFGALIAFIIAWATVGGLSARAATARPVNVLRSE